MRLWTLHPEFLDTQGLLALWREALLAKAVIHGQTKGYKHHPQLTRFYEHDAPGLAIGTFLSYVHAESVRRGYNFDPTKAGPTSASLAPIRATTGQLDYEWGHLLRKLQQRSPGVYAQVKTREARAHPLFQIADGPIADWERP